MSLKKEIYQKYLKSAMFELKKKTTNRDSYAICLKCGKDVKNVGLERLKKHRNICKLKEHQQVNPTISNPSAAQPGPGSRSFNFWNTIDSLNKENSISLNTPNNYQEESKNYHVCHSCGSSIANFDDVNTKLGIFFSGCNISLQIVESPFFREFVQSLNPNFKPPTRKTLSNSILNKVHLKLNKKKMDNNIASGVLIIDGWKNSSANTQNVVCILHKSNEESVFLDSWDFTSLSETGLALADVINEAADMAEKQFHRKIYCVVSDNASNMKKMGKESSKIFHTTCNSHSANLLAKSLVNMDFARKINKLLRKFKSPKYERAITEKGGKKISLACDTRWCTYRDTFRCCFGNLEIMRDIAKDNPKIFDTRKKTKTKTIDEDKNEKIDLMKFLMDENLNSTLTNALISLDPICQLINICQKDNTSIADAAEHWFKLIIPLIDPMHKDIIENRLEKVLTPIMLGANLLHPVYRGEIFKDDDYYELAMDFVKSNLKEVDHSGLNHYINEIGPFGNLKNKRNLSPETYWQLVEHYYPQLSELALKLLFIPASSAQVERLFSNWNFIHSNLRNRLTVERSKKLVDCYYSLKMSKSRKK